MIREIGVVVPAHNEERLVASCLRSLANAAKQGGVPPVRVVVVADSCQDATVNLAREWGADVLEVHNRSAGAARSAGFDLVVKESVVAHNQLWLCTTDADSTVPDQWFLYHVQKQAEGFDAVVGTVIVDDWLEHSSETPRRFARHYGATADGHPHVHGANLGFSGTALLRTDGFPSLALAEDHAFVADLMRCDLRICRTGHIPVITSARSGSRSPNGFGALLNAMDDPLWDSEQSSDTATEDQRTRDITLRTR